MKFNSRVCALCVLALALTANAQTVPVIVNNDKSVTVTYVNPSAKEVKIKGNLFAKGKSIIPLAKMFAKDGKADMRRGQDGVWTFTSEPLPSELYWYNLIVDDSLCYDPRNKDVVRDIATIYNYFIVTGGLADDYVSHTDKNGTLQHVWYPSSLNGMTKRRMAVYLPYGYAADTAKRYPVLYLLHGSGGDETAWADCGRLVQIMDNLIAQRRCEPMIVVMPNGNVQLAAAPGDDPDNPGVQPSANNVSSMFGKIEQAFVPEIVAYVDGNYRTINDKSHRAIAGLSLGGLHTLYISLNNPDVFNYVGLFSAQTTNTVDDSTISDLRRLGKNWNRLKDKIPFVGRGAVDRKITSLTGGADEDGDLTVYADLDGKLDLLFNGQPALFYIAVGKDDFTKKLNDKLRKKLNDNNYPYVYNETEGGHTWTNWRRYLIDYLPRLFR